MNEVSIHRPLPEIVLPDEIQRGEIVVIGGNPYVIDHVQEEVDPWTKRPALAVDTARSRIYYLILSCSHCQNRAAMKYAASMKDCDWMEIRYHGEFTWLCPECVEEAGLIR